MAPLQRRRLRVCDADAGSPVFVRPGLPLGWLDPPSDETLLALIRPPLVRVYLFVFCFLSLFHGAHRFRFTLYDGLQIKHLNELINVLCYGGALVGTVTAAYLLWRVP